MSADKEKSITVERLEGEVAARVSSVRLLNSWRKEVETGFQTFDVEYHAAGFCACCMRGE